ncbi:hypothetical protein JCM19037_4580 [Geomicrobium sp. JCM 19037]|uniref:hypothetical protein n=1 Tax=Geomicrobium sp. JCM 19037 TaxID=1460634 RepID=UPI00045F4211|nr:hypothetical protein [Geomicrobium sp. JCM 19037]GAK06028.1 hypothetical protein JCM19037_4580 [Geomicrobium sp. JCM 19037]
MYRTISGDTFDLIAHKTLGDDKLAGVIIEQNIEHVETLIFTAGVYLKIPDLPDVDLSTSLPPWKLGDASD